MLSPGESLTRSYPADAESVRRGRAELTDFARMAGARDERLEAVRLAVSEAMTNAVLHAYEEPGGRVSLSATYVAGELWVFVADQGAGLRVRRDRRGLGLGLAVIARLVDDFQIVSRATGGTEIRMQFKLEPAEFADQGPRGSVASAVSPA